MRFLLFFGPRKCKTSIKSKIRFRQVKKKRESEKQVPSILKPNLNDSHVQIGFGGQLLSDVSGRLGTVVVGLFENVKLFG